jgi:O-antigen ligase
MKTHVSVFLYIFSVVCFTTYLLVSVYDLGCGVGWSLGIGLPCIFLIVVPWYPLAGVIVVLALGYGLPRYSKELGLIQANLPFVFLVCVFVLLGWQVWLFRRREVPQLVNHRMCQLLIVFMVWLFISFLVAKVIGFADGGGYELGHQPIQYAEAALLFFLTYGFAGNKKNSIILSFSLVCILVARCLVHGKSGVYLNNDVGSLIPMILPLAFLGAAITKRWILRFFFISGASYLFIMFIHSQNRAGAVAFIAAFLCLLWQLRNRYKYVLVVSVIVLVCWVSILPSSYIDRFRVMWDPATKHSTASLDRATIVSRLELWRGAIQLVKENPWFGVGVGNYPKVIDRYFENKKGDVTHNNYLNVASEAGLIGFILYLLLFGYAFVVSFKLAPSFNTVWPAFAAQMLQLSLVAYLVAGLFISRQDMLYAYVLIGWIASFDVNSFERNLVHQSGVES